MSWVFYSISAFLLWGIGNITGKIIISRIAKHPLAYLVIYNIIMGILSLFPLLFKGLYLPGGKILILCIISGIIYVLAIIPYLIALKKEEVSRLVPLWQFIPLFTVFLAVIFLSEKLKLINYLSFFLLISGGLLISARNFKDIFVIRKVFWLMIGSSLIFAVMDIINKVIFSSSNYWNSFLLIRISALITALLILFYKDTYKNFSQTVKLLNFKKTAVLLSSEILDFVGMILYNLSLAIGPVSLITAMHGFQPLTVLIVAIIVSLWIPRYFKEQIDYKTIAYKLTAIVLMGVGVYLIYI